MNRHAIVIAVVLLTIVSPAFADYTVTGKFQFEDRDLSVNGFTGAVNPRPIRFADVQVQAYATSTVLARGATNTVGEFSIVVPGSTQQQIRAVCLTTSTQTPDLKLQVAVASSETAYSGSWSLASNAISYSGTSTLPMGTVTARYDSDAGKAFNIWDALVDGAEFVASPGIKGSFPATQFTIAWSRSPKSFGGYYDPAKKSAYIGPTNAQDDPLIYQQFGHFIADVYSKLDAPTGFSLFSDNQQDVRTAWAEGVSLFIGAAIRQFKGYPRPDFFILTDGTYALLSFDLESLTTYINPLFNYPPFELSKGSADTLAVAGALWDVTDGASTGDGSPGADDDPLQKDFSSSWNVLTNYIAKLTSAGIATEDFWDGWFSPSVDNGAAAEMRTIFLGHGIEFVADASEPDDAAAQAVALTLAQLSASASGTKVRIGEISLDDSGAIELYNAGDAEADLEGWALSASRGGLTATAFLSSIRLSPGEFLTVTGASGEPGRDRIVFTASVPIPWVPGQEGACALRDKNGAGVDFVRWGSSRELPPAGTGFTGNNPATPDPGRSLGRSFALADTDSGTDWTTQPPTLGTYNLSGEQVHRTFYPAGDVDHAAFNATAGRTYLIEALNLGDGADTVLELLSPNGFAVLAAGDDSSLGAGSRIVWKATADGRYIVRCSRYGKAPNYAQYGYYDLRVIESVSAIRVAQPDKVTVTKPGQGGQYATIADALAAAYNGDTVEIADSETYQETLRILGKSVTLRAGRGKSPVIDGRGKNQATLTLGGKDVRIESLTVLGGTYGIVVQEGAAAIVNTVVARASDNSTANGIAVVYEGVSARIVNCTVVNNRYVGIGVYNGAKAAVVNTIAYGNTQIDIGGDATAAAGLTVANSLSVKSNFTTSNGNITGDPKFVAADTNNYRLQSSSPAIDKGDGAIPDLPQTDADGLARSMAGSGTAAVPDMGAYEYLNPSTLTSTAVFPQIAAGGTQPEYRTVIVAVNTGAATATARVGLTQSSGDPFNVTVSGAGEWAGEEALVSKGGDPVLAKTGSSFDVAVLPSGTVRIEAAGSENTVSGYAKILSNLPLDGTALFKTLQGTTVLSEAGVGLSKPARSFIVYIDNKNNALSGYAVANTGTLPATLTMTLRDAGGGQRDTKSTTLAAGRHFASFAYQDFASAGAGFEGTVEFSSDQAVSAVALRYDNTNLDPLSQVFSTIPVLTDEAATTLYFPQVADGGGYRTNFILVNPSAGTAATAKLEFFDNDGRPLPLPIGGAMKTSHEVALPARGAARFLTDGTSAGTQAGWVKVTSTAAIGGASIFQRLNGDMITSEAGVASSPSDDRFTVYVETIGEAYSGLAICNPNDSSVDITLRLRDSSGTQLDTYSTRLAPYGHVASFFTQWFGAYRGFEGTLDVSATQKVSAVALRYDGGVFATLPVIP